MAVTKCKECGGKLASSAKACPHCGGRVRRIGVLGWLFIIFFVAPALLGVLVAVNTDQDEMLASRPAQPAPAPPDATEAGAQSGSSLVKEHCVRLGEFAKEAMTSRQAGVLITEVQAQNDAILESIVIDAYETSRFLGEEYQARAIADFQNEIYLKCIKGRF